MVDYRYVQVALFLQLVLWLKLYHYPMELGRLAEALFYALGVGFMLLVYVTLPYVGFFTPWLLIQYTVYVLLSVMAFRGRFGFRQSLCLGFLVVYLNSFYWELFYHVYEFQRWLPASLGWVWWYLRLPQWLRAVPALFLARSFEVKDTGILKLSLVMSFLMTYFRFRWHLSNLVLHPVHRAVCLAALIYTVYKSSERV